MTKAEARFRASGGMIDKDIVAEANRILELMREAGYEIRKLAQGSDGAGLIRTRREGGRVFTVMVVR